MPRAGGRLLVLGLDSSTSRESVAVVRDGRVLVEVRLDMHDVASRRLLPAAVFALESCGLNVSQLDGLAVALGPGSFTGLRVALGTLQGLALGSDRPCVGVSSLAALGAAAAADGLPVAAWIDALRGEVYAEHFDAQGRSLGEARRATPEALLADLAPTTCFAGDGAEHHRALIAARLPGARFAAHAFLAASVACLGALCLERGEGVAPEALRPLYLGEAHVRAALVPR